MVELIDEENQALLKLLEEDEKVFTGELTGLDNTSVKIPYLHGKYMKLLFMEKEKYQLLKSKLDVNYGERYHYYRFDGNFELQRTEIDFYIKKDKKYVKDAYKTKMSYERMKMIEEAIAGLKTKSFAIKHAIDYLKFKNGLAI